MGLSAVQGSPISVPPCFGWHEPAPKAEQLQSQLLAQQFMEAAFVSFQPHSHPPLETQPSFNCYASTVLLLYQRHKVTTLGK